MGISLRTHKILWARSGGKCAICKNDLISDPFDLDDDPSVVGDEAHIIARKESFTRGDYDSLSSAERDHYSNLILLCKNHHKQIDDQPAHYTVEKLRATKHVHEEEVKAQLSPADARQQQDDLIYTEYIQYWESKAALSEWRDLSARVCDQIPSVPKQWYENQRPFLLWLLSRVWPRRYPTLEYSLNNYAVVLQDFLVIFDRHIGRTPSNDWLWHTEQFYKLKWDEERYFQLRNEYEKHIGLINDLFFELTRAANLVCDRVRESVFPRYRLKEGVLLIERHSVGFEMKTVRSRLEYNDDERIDRPYPGLEQYETVRYTRDSALDPEEPKPTYPENEDD